MEHEAQTLLFELFAIFLAAKVIGEIFERFKLPAVLGEILAGAIIGPYALGWIHPGSFTTSIAEIGAIFVLFHAGLETSPGDLIRVGPKALLVAIAGIIVPFALGYGYMRMRGDAATESIFVGAAMVATSVGITARVLGDLGVLSTTTAKIILGAAVFDDILGMLLLAGSRCVPRPATGNTALRTRVAMCGSMLLGSRLWSRLGPAAAALRQVGRALRRRSAGAGRTDRRGAAPSA